MAETVPPKIAVPVTLQIGSTTAEIGSAELPMSTGPATKVNGVWQLPMTVDHDEFRHRIADLLRNAADEFERGPANGD